MRSVRIQILAFVLLGALFFSIPLSVTAEDAAFSYVSNVWACYKSFCERNDYSYIIEQSIKSTYHEEEIISSDYIIEAHTSYSINILLPNSNNLSAYIMFSATDINASDKSFYIRCYNDEVPASTIKELILTTLYFSNNNISEKYAQQKLSEIVTSFNGRTHSNVVDGTDYLIFVSYDEDFLNRTITQINVIDKNRLKLNEETRELYSEMTYEQMCAPLNVGEAVTFIGTPIKSIENESSDPLDANVEYWEIKLSDGIIKIRINFDFNPISLGLNTSYRFYGNLMGGEDSGTGAVRVDYVEIID